MPRMICFCMYHHICFCVFAVCKQVLAVIVQLSAQIYFIPCSSRKTFHFICFIYQENEITDVWQTSSSLLKNLGRGSLYLELNVNKSDNFYTLRGNITARTSCECKICFHSSCFIWYLATFSTHQIYRIQVN